MELYLDKVENINSCVLMFIFFYCVLIMTPTGMNQVKIILSVVSVNGICLLLIS